MDLLKLSGVGFDFDVPNKRLVLPALVREQARKQAVFAAESFLLNRMTRQGLFLRDFPWIRPLFKFSDPESGQITDRKTNALVREARGDKSFFAKWDQLGSMASTLSLQGLKMAMKKHYGSFLRENNLSDSSASVNAYALLALREHQKGAETFIAEKVEPRLNLLNRSEFSSYDDPRDQFMFFLSQGAYLNLPTIGLSEHAGFENPLMKFIDAHSDLFILSGSKIGQNHFKRFGNNRVREYDSVMGMRESVKKIKLI
ncbi:hypothetical protein HY994_02275 [Candidatus Micrarchaeota archaeon]|nr:hypothetical protein [Candidatus Micrarchaeota archaeon]